MAKKQPEMIIEKIPVNEILVENRGRKDFSKVTDLKNSMKRIGLQSPIKVNKITTDETNEDGTQKIQYNLIYGETRLRAAKELKWETIDAIVTTIDDEERLLEIEIAENEARQDFAMAERTKLAMKFEEMIAAKARNKSKENLKKGTSSRVTQNVSLQDENEKSKEKIVRTDTQVANRFNFGSREKYRKCKEIVEHEADFDPEDFEKWNAGKISTNKMYNKLKPPTEKRTPSFLKQTKEPNFTPETPDISSLLPTEEIRVDNCLKHYKYFFENAYDLIQELLQAYEPAMEFIFNKRGLGTKDAENKARMEYIRDWAIQFAGIPKGYKRIDNEKIPVLASNEEQYEFIRRAKKREQQNQLSIEKGMIAVEQVLEQERIDALNGNPINENEGNYIF